MPKIVILAFLILISYEMGISQSDGFDFRKDFRYQTSAAIDEITIDGILDEKTWSLSNEGKDFWQKSPYYEKAANPKTIFKISYNEDYLYVATICYQKGPIIIESLKRDTYWNNDGIAIILDPLNSKANAVLFGTSAVGVQWDATRTETSDISSDWSNKWYVETNITDSLWTAEFAIPFKILRYGKNEKEWGLNFVRNVTHLNQFHNWTAVPEGFWPPNPAFAGTLSWEEAPEPKKGNFNLIPFATTRISKEKTQDTEVNFDAGIDARVSLTSALSLDLTFNPDFSQIEVDELVTNLTRFDIGLPEKRTFFLENSDLFADFGTGGMRPFFSRRIGLNDQLQAVPILYGARLSGNLTQNTRIGVLNIHEKTTDTSLGQNNSAISFKQQFGRSFIQGLFVNRQAFEGNEKVKGDFGRNASLEGLYLTDDGKLGVWGAMHRSFKPGVNQKNMVFNSGFQFRNPTWEVINDNIFFQDNYFADLGFINRVNNYDAERDTTIRMGYNSSYTSVDYRIRPKEKNIQLHRFGVENLTILNPDWSFNEQYNRLRYFLSLKNTSEFRIRLNFNALELLFPFTFTGAVPLPAARYKTFDINFEYESDRRKNLSVDFSIQSGGFYNGRLSKFEANANYRIQPWANFSLGYQWNDLSFPDPYGKTKITAFVSTVEIGFNKNLLWTTLFQYVDQAEYMGINSRIQWRYAPMSDIFLVYVDNYDVIEQIGSRTVNSNNRAMILKINFWY